MCAGRLRQCCSLRRMRRVGFEERCLASCKELGRPRGQQTQRHFTVECYPWKQVRKAKGFPLESSFMYGTVYNTVRYSTCASSPVTPRIELLWHACVALLLVSLGWSTRGIGARKRGPGFKQSVSRRARLGGKVDFFRGRRSERRMCGNEAMICLFFQRRTCQKKRAQFFFPQRPKKMKFGLPESKKDATEGGAVYWEYE